MMAETLSKQIVSDAFLAECESDIEKRLVDYCEKHLGDVRTSSYLDDAQAAFFSFIEMDIGDMQSVNVIQRMQRAFLMALELTRMQVANEIELPHVDHDDPDEHHQFLFALEEQIRAQPGFRVFFQNSTKGVDLLNYFT